MKLTALAIIIHPLIILSFTALAVSVSAGIAGLSILAFTVYRKLFISIHLRRRTTVRVLKG